MPPQKTSSDMRSFHDIEYRVLTDADGERVSESYALLQEAMEAGCVEDFESFRGTISPATDDAVCPKLVCATFQGDMVGITIGAYLRNLNMGYIAYSAVRPIFRRQGIYSEMRARLIGLFDKSDFVISELEEGSRLFQRYLDEWNAFALPCDYEQPEAQGLISRRLKLVLQPVVRTLPPGESESLAIVRELYERIYRIQDVSQNESFRRIAESLRESPDAVSMQVR